MDKKKFTAVLMVIRAVADELAKAAKTAMPPLEEGEKIVGESYENGFYTRYTTKGKYVYSFAARALLEGGETCGE